MAFLGGLFGDIKTRDVVAGAAKRISTDIKDDMDDTKDQINRLTELRLQRVSRDQERRNTKITENTEVIKDMEGKLGSIEAAHFLVDKYGFREAQNVASELVKKKKLSGGRIDPAEYLGIEAGTGGAVTASQLASYVTPTAAVPDLKDFGPIGTGYASLFQPGAAEKEFKQRSDRAIAAAGYDLNRTSVQDLPSAPKGKDLYEWQIYTDDSAVKQAANLQTIQNDLLMREQKAKSPDEKKALEQERLAAKAEQTQMLLQYEYEQDLMLQTKAKPLKASQVEKYVKSIGGQIATAYGLAKDSNWVENTLTGEMIFSYKGINAAAQKEMQQGSQSLVKEINKAVLDGKDAAAISDAIFKAVDSNTRFTYVSKVDDFGEGSFVFGEGKENRLINDELQDTNGQPVFTGLIQTQNPPPAVTSQTANPAATATVQNPQGAAATTIANKKQAYQAAGNNTQARGLVVQNLLRSLNNAGVINPATSNPYTAAEIEAELSK